MIEIDFLDNFHQIKKNMFLSGQTYGSLNILCYTFMILGLLKHNIIPPGQIDPPNPHPCN